MYPGFNALNSPILLNYEKSTNHTLPSMFGQRNIRQWRVGVFQRAAALSSDKNLFFLSLFFFLFLWTLNKRSKNARIVILPKEIFFYIHTFLFCHIMSLSVCPVAVVFSCLFCFFEIQNARDRITEGRSLKVHYQLTDQRNRGRTLI